MVIEAKNITKNYKEVVALDNVSISIDSGDRIALIGANGAGKTTLIEIILGLTHPTKGEIKFNFDFKKSPLEKIGIQFQDAQYPVDLAVNEIIEFFMDVSSVKIDKVTFDKMIASFELKEFITYKAHSLSGGQRQKLNVFLALVSNPSIILLDELTTGLDVKVSKSITAFIKEYTEKSKRTMILVSHNPVEVENLCNRIIVMKEGKMVYDKSLQDTLKEFKSIDKLMNHFI